MSYGATTKINGKVTANGTVTANCTVTYQTISINTTASKATAAVGAAIVCSSAATATATSGTPKPATTSAAAETVFGHMFATPTRGSAVGGRIGLDDVGRVDGPDAPMSPVTPKGCISVATPLAYPSLVPSMMDPQMTVVQTQNKQAIPHVVDAGSSSLLDVGGGAV